MENPFGLCGHASDAISRSDEIDEIWNRSPAKTSLTEANSAKER